MEEELYIEYKEEGEEVIYSIPKAELIGKAGHLNAINAYRTSSGNDVNSLKGEFQRLNGNLLNKEAINLGYNLNSKKAEVVILWNKLNMISKVASVVLQVTGNYDFQRTLKVHIAKWMPLRQFARLTIPDNVESRDAVHVATLIVSPICTADEKSYYNSSRQKHVVEISSEEYGLAVQVGDQAIGNFSKSINTECPIDVETTFRVLCDFGKIDRSDTEKLRITFKIDGEEFSAPLIQVPPHAPQIISSLTLLPNKKLTLSPERINIATLSLKSDAYLEGKSVSYDISSDSEYIDIEEGKGTLVPGSKANVPLIFIGNKMDQLPNGNLSVNVYNNGQVIQKITLCPPNCAGNVANAENSLTLIAPYFIRIDENYQDEIKLFDGEKKTIRFNFSVSQDVESAEITIDGDNNSENNRKITQLRKNVQKSIDFVFSSDIQNPDKKLTIKVHAPYFRDSIFHINIRTLAKKAICANMIFMYNGSKYVDDIIRPYRGNEQKTIGILKISCKPKNNADVISNPIRFDMLDIQSLQIEQGGTSAVCLDLGNRSPLKVGENCEIPVKSYTLPQDRDEVDCKIRLLDKTQSIKFQICDKSPQQLPSVSFTPADNLIYPCDSSCIKIGELTITPISITSPLSTIERSNGRIVLQEHFYFDENRQNNSQQVDRKEKTDKEKTYNIFFDAKGYFDNKDNITREREEVPLGVLYQDDNVSIDGELLKNFNFSISQNPAIPICQIKFIKDNEDPLVLNFDAQGNAEIEIKAIGVSEALRKLLPREIFKLEIINAQTIKVPSRILTVTKLSVDKDFVCLGSEIPIKIANGVEPYIIPVNIDWTRVEVGCREFNISMEIDGRNKVIKVACNFLEEITDGWFSLDVGTHAIVMAQMHEENIQTIHLEDSEASLESNADMISSTIVLNEDNNERRKYRIVLSPGRQQYSEATAILPPIKFIVGQNSFPFCNKLREMGVSTLYNKYLEETELSRLQPARFVKSIYEDVFSRMEQAEAGNMRKLVLTYPSTYTIEQKNKLGELISKRFHNLQSYNMHFVAESDAALAYYLYYKRIANERPLIDGEKILIYDMGAGTLDISFALVKLEKNNAIATIEKRIGVPIAGNYLDYCIYEYLKDHLSDDALDPKTLKGKMISIKEKLSDNDKLNEPVTDVALKIDDNNITYKDILDSNEVKSFLSLCTESVFNLLLGDDWKRETITFVLSGRGCLFDPLKNRIKESEYLQVESIADTPEEMKLCVAKGAIKFEQVFTINTQQPFRIVSFSHYAPISLVYRSYNGTAETYKCVILTSSNETGIPSIDIRPRGRMVIVQSYLPTDRISDSYNRRFKHAPDLDEPFISEMYSVKREELGIDEDYLNTAQVEFSIDDNNGLISCSIQHQPLSRFSYSVSVENNTYYIKSMWPFNNDNNCE